MSSNSPSVRAPGYAVGANRMPITMLLVEVKAARRSGECTRILADVHRHIIQSFAMAKWQSFGLDSISFYSGTSYCDYPFKIGNPQRFSLYWGSPLGMEMSGNPAQKLWTNKFAKRSWGRQLCGQVEKQQPTLCCSLWTAGPQKLDMGKKYGAAKRPLVNGQNWPELNH